MLQTVLVSGVASTGPLDKRTWAVTGNTTNLRDGTIHSDAMARTAVDWTGGLATLNGGSGFLLPL